MRHTPTDFLVTTKILLKKPGPVERGLGSKAPFSIRVSGFEEDVTCGVREERGGGFSNSR